MLLRRVWPSRPAFENPFTDFDQLGREMLRMLESVAGGDRGYDGSAGVSPRLNVSEDDNNFYVRAEVPGIKPANLSVSALPNSLSISGRREIPPQEESVSYHRRERAEGAFSRTVSLPTEIASDKVDARYADGILSLTLPKAETAKPRQITVAT
jgi:HSP20 family protein